MRNGLVTKSGNRALQITQFVLVISTGPLWAAFALVNTCRMLTIWGGIISSLGLISVSLSTNMAHLACSMVLIGKCIMLYTLTIRTGKKITEGIATNPLTEPFVVSVNIPKREFSRDSCVLL